MNLLVVTGRLGRDAELKYTTQGTAVCNFTVAVERKWGKGEQSQTKTIWLSVNLWGKYGESINRYLRKGRKVTVQGELDEDKWEDKEGKKRSRMFVHAREVDIHFEQKPTEPHWQEQAEDKEVNGNIQTDSSFAADDIPF